MTIAHYTQIIKCNPHYTEASRLDPQDVCLSYNLACLFIAQNKPAEALASLPQAFALNPALTNKAKADVDLQPIYAEAGFQRLLTELTEERKTADSSREQQR